ncbi:MAG: MepB family protein [Pedobacter sp.]|nr:MAG: MepB family protein [Pedobacter sp.]
MSDLNNNENLLIIRNFYDKCNLNFSDLKLEKESLAYDACTFRLNAKAVIHRTAKITPTKIGQFVTIWKRNKNGQTEPFHINDDFDFIIISTRNGELFGQFIFPKSILVEKEIISHDKRQGKRGIRVYPAWDVTVNKQAQRTQQWQTKYFIEETIASIDKINHLIKVI